MKHFAWFFALVIIALGAWIAYQERTNPTTRDREYMLCQTALMCAAHIERSILADLESGSADFSSVRRDGAVVTVTYDLKSVRADFPGGRVEGGRTLEQWADDELAGFPDQACRELDHRDFVRMGGTMAYSYQFSDGEVLRCVVVDRCP